MAQSSMTVRIEADIKQQFDRLCRQFGMSTNTAINVFINQVVRKKRIPFVISVSPEQDELRRQAHSALIRAHAEAVSKEGEELTLDEINREISETRKQRA